MAPRRNSRLPNRGAGSSRAVATPSTRERKTIDQELGVSDNDQIPTPSTSNTDNTAISQSSADEALLGSMQVDEMYAIGSHSRRLIQTIKKLETLDIDATLPSLPKFVIVGDQSTGKSSIVEALCNVMLPRSAGTCTRVPFMITTTATKDGEPWRCDVSLHSKYHYDSTGRGNLYERWIECKHEAFKFASVLQKLDLEDVLKRAQQALLNPRDNPQIYTTAAYEDRVPQVQFSPNLICLEIKGPDLPEFSFYDLPGSINVVDESDQHPVEFVEKLVKSYLSDEKALILLACQAELDIENSTTFRFVRQCQAEQRCLGVLTKPDLLSPARLPVIVRMLDGTNFRLGRGWYVTKQPSQAQLDAGVTLSDARQLEKDFFATGPFNNDRFARFAHRFGISNLQDAVATRLQQHILENLDDIIQRVQTRSNAIDTTLSTFQEKDGHPMMTVLKVVQGISSAVEKQITGISKDFRPPYELIKQAFRDHLQKSISPDFDATTPGYVPGQTTNSQSVTIIDSDDEEMEEQSHTPTPARSSNKRKATATPSSSKRIKTESMPPAILAQKPKFTLAIVKSIRDTCASDCLPGQQSREVTDTIIKQMLRGWSRALETVLDKIDDRVQEIVLKVMNEQLASYEHCELKQKTLEAAVAHLQPLLAKQKEAARSLLAREQHKPITTLKTDEYTDAASEQLFRKRNRKRIMEHLEKLEANGGKVLTPEEKQKRLGDEKTLKEIGHDPHKSLVEALVLPFAYYQIATARFVDNVALLLEVDLLHALQTQLEDVLIDGVGAKDADTCEQLLTENLAIERERQRLLAERGRLQAAMAELQDLPNLSTS